MEIRLYGGRGVAANSYLVSDEKTKAAFIVDAGKYNHDLVIYVIENDLDIKYLILTHGHGDHIGGVLEYKEAFPQMQVVASIEEKEMLNNPSMNYSQSIWGIETSFDADIYVNDGDLLKVGNLDLKVLHVPGHSKGGIGIYVDKALFSGDSLFRQSIGRTDLFGGDYEKLIASIKDKFFSLPEDTEIYPGHETTSNIAYEKENNPFV